MLTEQEKHTMNATVATTNGLTNVDDQKWPALAGDQGKSL
jgi:hypothetical protein